MNIAIVYIFDVVFISDIVFIFEVVFMFGVVFIFDVIFCCFKSSNSMPGTASGNYSGWGGVGLIVIIRLSQFHCSCNCLLDLSLTILVFFYKMEGTFN